MGAETGESFGDLLRRYRLEAGLTQEALAERAALSVRNIQSLESGANRPLRDTARRLLGGLGLGAEEHARFMEAAAPAPRRRPPAGIASAAPMPVGEFPPVWPVPPPALLTVPVGETGLEPARARLVGRDAEMGRLAAALTRASGGQGALLFLAGEPGIGKTRLALEAAILARARGFLVLLGRAYAPESVLAYALLLDAFGPYVRALDEQRRAALVDGLPDLGRLFGGLRLPAPEPLGDPALEKTRLFEAVARFLQRLAAGAPVLLVLDDLHWADRASLELIHYLVRGLAAQRVLVLATCRDGEMDTEPALRPLLRSLRRTGLLADVAVPRLQPDAVAALVWDTLDGEAPAEIVRLIERRSGGTPLFVEMLLGSLVDSGCLHRSGGVWTLSGDMAQEVDIPPVVQDIIADRLERLGADERHILQVIAIDGEATPIEVLCVAGEVTDETLLDALVRLRVAGLVTAQCGGEEDAYGLGHPLIGEVVRAALPALARRRLHLALASALERVRPDDVDRLARHYREAGGEADQRRALEVLLAAGERARNLYAHGEAARHFTAALELVRQGERGDLLPLVLERLGEAWGQLGENAAAIAVWDEALAAYGRAGDVHAVARLHHALAVAEWENGGRAGAVTGRLDAGIAVLADEAPSRELADLRLTRVVMLARRGEAAGAAAAAREFLTLAERLGSPQAAGQAGAAMLRVHLARGHFVAARAAGQQALAMVEESGDTVTVQALHHLLAAVTLVMGQPAAAREHAQRSLELARRLGVPTLEVTALVVSGSANLDAGDWDAAAQQIGEGLTIARRIGQARAIGGALGGYARLLIVRGELTEAATTLAEARDRLGDGLDAGQHTAGLAAGEAWLAIEHGDKDRLRALIPRLATYRLVSIPWTSVTLGESYVFLGETDAALAVAADLRGLDTPGDPYLTTLAERITGLARAAGGETDAAREAFGHAAGAFHALALPFEAARAHLEWATLADGPDAVAAATESLQTFERLGARRYADRARKVLRRLGVRPRPVRRPGSDGGPLSQRELEVARLMATGLTTAQVAERLIISPHTADTHLRRIYERLGLNSRAALTRYLAESGLLTA